MKANFNPAHGNPIISWSIVCGILFSSCVNTQKATYFVNQGDETLKSVRVPLSVIQNNDILSISTSSLNNDASLIFNTPNAVAISTATNPSLSGSTYQSVGYLVNSDGFIQLPILGSIKAAGLTKEQLKVNITQELIDRKLLLDPIVNIRFLNFRVTVLGEVGHPCVVPVQDEKISLLEAIGFAGDLTVYAKRDNILLIREENSEKTLKRINLNSSELFSSPYYYLKTNDIVYVESNKNKVASSGRAQVWVPAILSGLSFLAIIFDHYVK